MSQIYRLRFDRFNAVATFAASDPAELNNVTRGETTTLNLYFTENKLLVESGEAHTVPSGGIEVYDEVENNGTLTVDGELIAYTKLENNGMINNNGTISVVANGLEKLLADYNRVAGDFAVIESITSAQNFREQIDSNVVNSLVVGIEPAQELQTQSVQGVWGLISGITDSRSRPLTNPQIALEVRILDEFGEYSDITSVQSDLRV